MSNNFKLKPLTNKEMAIQKAKLEYQIKTYGRVLTLGEEVMLMLIKPKRNLNGK